MAGDYDYVLMVDSDIQLPSDALVKLLECESDIAWMVLQEKNKNRSDNHLYIRKRL